MKHQKRRYFTREELRLMWDRWQEGDSWHEIARLLGRSHGTIAGVLSRTGGVRPSPRERSRRALGLSEREEISRGLAAGQSFQSIAALLGRAPSTVSREVKRNDGRRQYRAAKADQAAWDRARSKNESLDPLVPGYRVLGLLMLYVR